ncbi:MAG: cation:proton antiporter [Gemmatimonadaceae bacterium]
MNRVDTGLLVIALTLATAVGARRLSTPLPIVLAIVGIIAGAMWRFVPGLAPVTVPPDRVLFIFLPPLLTTAAYALPLSAFRRNIVPIALLAVGLVLATMATAAVVAHVLIGLPWAAAFVLGAIVAPPDPVAATTVGSKSGLAHRLVIILEGEGMVNDAIAIVAYRLAVVAAVTGGFTWTGAGLAVLWEAPAGVAVGLAAGYAVAPLRRRLDHVTLEAGISLFLPYVTYEIADRIGASAVLAVVTLGFILQRQETTASTAAVRLAARTVWASLRFASTALVFLLLGLLIGEATSTRVSSSLVLAGVAVTVAVIALRFLWIYTVPNLRGLRSGARSGTAPSPREAAVLGWAGMRGVVSLALALALPALPSNGNGRPRDSVLFITLIVIVGTLVLQGVTLLPLVTWLGVGDPDREAHDERRARARARRAGLAALDRTVHSDPSLAADCRALAERIADGSVGIAAPGTLGGRPDKERPLASALEAERIAVMHMRDTGQIGESVAERLVTEVDVDSMTVSGTAARLTGSDS